MPCPHVPSGPTESRLVRKTWQAASRGWPRQSYAAPLVDTPPRSHGSHGSHGDRRHQTGYPVTLIFNMENHRKMMGKPLENHKKMEVLPSGKHTKNYGKSSFLMGKSTKFRLGHYQVRKLFVYQRVSRLNVYKLRIFYTKAQQKESQKHMF